MLLIKINQQDVFCDSKNISDSTVYFTRVYIICLIYPRTSQLALTGTLQVLAELSAFEYESKESRESNNHTKRLNWSSFKVIDTCQIFRKQGLILSEVFLYTEKSKNLKKYFRTVQKKNSPS